MKRIIIVIIVSISLILLSVFVGSRTDYNAQIEPEVESTVVAEPIAVNNITEAQKQLNEAKKLLDDEEVKLLGDIEEINKETEAKIAEKESRLEEIRAVRLSFSQAPELVQ